MKNTDILLSLLRCALFNKQPDDESKKLMADKANWLFQVAKPHDIAHLIAYTFEKLGITIQDEALSKTLKKQRLIDVMRYEQIKHELNRLKAVLEEEKIPFIPLKGAVIREYYPEPWMRTSGDIDILVREKDLDRCTELIKTKLDYSSKNKRNYHDISLFADNGVHLELHFSICENIEKIDAYLSKAWEYAFPIKEGGYEYAFSPEYFMFHIISHMAYHFIMGGCGIRAFCDLYLLRKNYEYDEQKLYELLKRCEIDTFYKSIVDLADVWFESKSHNDLTLSMQTFVLWGGIYGAKYNRVAARRGCKSKSSYIIERIFMPYEQLTVCYPSLEGKPYLTPFYQIKRWCRIAFSGRIQYSVEEFAANSKLPANMIEKTSQLLTKLGLK